MIRGHALRLDGVTTIEQDVDSLFLGVGFEEGALRAFFDEPNALASSHGTRLHTFHTALTRDAVPAKGAYVGSFNLPASTLAYHVFELP